MVQKVADKDSHDEKLLEAGKEGGDERAGRSPWGPIFLILVIELCERLSYYTIAGTLRNYIMNGAGKSQGQAAAMTASFGTIGWMMCLPGGMVSDKYGLYGTILVACIIYVAGTTMVALSSIPPIGSDFKTAIYLLGTMVFVCVGMGGIKPNIMNFGANQITADGERGDKQRESFFSYFYVAINLGCFVPFLYLVTLATSGQPPAIPKEWGFFAAYLVAAVAMALAGLMYVCGTRLYITKKPSPPPENEIGVVFRTILHTARQGSMRALVSLFGWILMPVFILLSLLVSFLPDGGVGGVVLTYLSLAIGIISCFCVAVTHMDNSFLQSLPARPDLQGRDDLFTIEDVRATLKTIPLMLLINISFNLCYNSMNAAFPSQACQMNCFIGKTQQLNGAFFNVGDALAIVIFAPLFEALLYPLWARIQGKDVSLGQKLMAGLCCAAASNAVAAILETARKNAPLMDNRAFSDCAPDNTYMRNISAFYMFIPFGLVGFGEILVMPSMYYYAYEAAPKKVRATIQAFNLVAQGSISGAFSAALQLAFVPKDLDTGNLNIYYYVNIAVAIVGIGLYGLYRHLVGSSRDFVRGINLEEAGSSVHRSLVGSFAQHPTRRD
jgi:peptide/histidine transporter 3/4